MATIQVSIGSKYGSKLVVETFQRDTNLDESVLTVNSECFIKGHGDTQLFDKSRIQFFGTVLELQKLADEIYAACESLKEPKPEVEPEVIGIGDDWDDMHPDIEESLTRPQI